MGRAGQIGTNLKIWLRGASSFYGFRLGWACPDAIIIYPAAPKNRVERSLI